MLENAGLQFVGCDESGNRMEVRSKYPISSLSWFLTPFKSESAFAYDQIVELQDHPFYIGVQFHPEFKSRPRRPSPPFTGTPISYAFMVIWESALPWMQHHSLPCSGVSRDIIALWFSTQVWYWQRLNAWEHLQISPMVVLELLSSVSCTPPGCSEGWEILLFSRK